eukprot:6447926-Pyramimonas_sp.AAC.1
MEEIRDCLKREEQLQEQVRLIAARYNKLDLEHGRKLGALNNPCLAAVTAADNGAGVCMCVCVCGVRLSGCYVTSDADPRGGVWGARTTREELTNVSTELARHQKGYDAE